VADFVEPEPYVDNSYTRVSRIGFEDINANGQIGELVLGTYAEKSTSYNRTGMFRITFDPKLDKTSNFRLYLDFRVTVNPS
jgi:hypothetical protein